MAALLLRCKGELPKALTLHIDLVICSSAGFESIYCNQWATNRGWVGGSGITDALVISDQKDFHGDIKPTIGSRLQSCPGNPTALTPHIGNLVPKK